MHNEFWHIAENIAAGGGCIAAALVGMTGIIVGIQNLSPESRDRVRKMMDHDGADYVPSIHCGDLAGHVDFRLWVDKDRKLHITSKFHLS